MCDLVTENTHPPTNLLPSRRAILRMGLLVDLGAMFTVLNIYFCYPDTKPHERAPVKSLASCDCLALSQQLTTQHAPDKAFSAVVGVSQKLGVP